METNSFSELTEKCQNFKNYLMQEFKVSDFGEFLCAYKFSLTEINDLVAAASSENVVPASLRVYYGCDAGGKNHRLFLAVLDAEDNVLQAQSTPAPNQNTLLAMAAKDADAAKCPPGRKMDAILGPIFL